MLGGSTIVMGQLSTRGLWDRDTRAEVEMPAALVLGVPFGVYNDGLRSFGRCETRYLGFSSIHSVGVLGGG